MTSTTATTKGRHRKAARPMTPLSSISPATRRSMTVAATSGLAIAMLAPGVNAANSTEVAASAGSLEAAGVGAIAAPARDAVATNEVITTGDVAALADVEAAPEVSAEAPVVQEQAAETTDAAATQNSSAAATGGTQSAAAAAAANASGSSIVSIALQYEGSPYVFGGSSPVTGWDCSGFVQYVYAQAGISLPRTSYAQAGAGRMVSAAEAQPGDIVYYGYHVGIYVGNGMMIDARTPFSGTVYGEVWGSPIGYIRIGG